MPLVSIITPAFRTEKYLTGFLEHLSHQTIIDDVEVILNLNEPSKLELKIVAPYVERYQGTIKLLISDERDSISVSMNNCIRASTSEYITIWNIDDLRTPNSLELQLHTMQNTKDVVACGGTYVQVREFGSRVGDAVEKGHVSQAELLSEMHLGPFFMFRRSVFERIGFFDEQLWTGADFDFAIRLARSGRIAFISEPLGYYLDEGLGASTSPNSKQAVERTVIELRYGAYKKLDLTFIPYIGDYSIPYVLNFGTWIPIKSLFSDYDLHLEANRKRISKSCQPKVFKRLKNSVSGLRKSFSRNAN
jgi:GT2 family glycosyltransferase